MQRGRTVSGSLSSQLCFNSSKQSFLSLHATIVKLSTSIQAVFICDQYFCFMYIGQHIQEFSPFPSQPHKLRLAAAPWERNRASRCIHIRYWVSQMHSHLGIFSYVRNATNLREFPGKIFMVVQIPLAEQYTRSVTFLSVIPIPPQIDLAPCLDSIGRPSGSTTANARRHSVQKIMHNIRSPTTKVSHVNSLHLKHGRQRSYPLLLGRIDPARWSLSGPIPVTASLPYHSPRTNPGRTP
ncbi:hypothetical protein B0H13DRAFT_1870434 [Mycena leptocephala]|nr:hypothetical protein B0H13DRAFT_1870434 [Mycena leptocephala]